MGADRVSLDSRLTKIRLPYLGIQFTKGYMHPGQPSMETRSASRLAVLGVYFKLLTHRWVGYNKVPSLPGYNNLHSMNFLVNVVNTLLEQYLQLGLNLRHLIHRILLISIVMLLHYSTPSGWLPEMKWKKSLSSRPTSHVHWTHSLLFFWKTSYISILASAISNIILICQFQLVPSRVHSNKSF